MVEMTSQRKARLGMAFTLVLGVALGACVVLLATSSDSSESGLNLRSRNLWGYSASDHALEVFNEMKMKHKMAYIIYKIEGSSIIAKHWHHKRYLPDDYLENFVNDIMASGEPRWGVVDWNHKLLFVQWSPDRARARLKMQYASSSEAFRQELVGVQRTIQASDDGELTPDEIVEACASNVL
eukprot:GFYU01001831.1.p1 GENE.GFYU01001831.1~~GFYU01001831.1.p1  ORF type:complete len:198 (-),score=27.23 GFYU01001831.1:175-720(-)